MTDIAVPEDLWDANKIPEGIVANWFYSDGAEVPQGATVAELMVEKSSFDITAPATGTLRIVVPKDGTVRPGSVIARLESG
ncbi:biotin/lipoyl-containing protein [Aquibaculum sediminis]|uniref:biotin/lipoyl-containing protein n=1 Tax=Aquibaculum sediminis TaxID=3231907 RepID=UPI0034531ADC